MEKPPENPEPLVKTVRPRGGRPPMTAEQMIRKGVSAHQAALCVELRELIDEKFGSLRAYVDSAGTPTRYKTLSAKLTADKEWDWHDITAIVGRVTQKHPTVDRDALTARLNSLWVAAFPARAAHTSRRRAADSPPDTAVDNLAYTTRLQAEQLRRTTEENERLRRLLADQEGPGVPDRPTIVDGEVVVHTERPDADIEQEYRTAARLDDRAETARALRDASPAPSTTPDPRRVVLGTVAIGVPVWAWSWLSTPAAVALTVAVVLGVAVMMPGEFYRHRLLLQAATAPQAIRWRRFPRARLTAWIDADESVQVVLVPAATPRWITAITNAVPPPRSMTFRFTGSFRRPAFDLIDCVDIDSRRELPDPSKRLGVKPESMQDISFAGGIGLSLFVHGGRARIRWRSPGIVRRPQAGTAWRREWWDDVAYYLSSEARWTLKKIRNRWFDKAFERNRPDLLVPKEITSAREHRPMRAELLDKAFERNHPDLHVPKEITSAPEHPPMPDDWLDTSPEPEGPAPRPPA